MHPSEDEHIGAATIEAYSVHRLDSDALEATEYHLLVCADCRARLVKIEPFNCVHYTRDGPFYSRVTRLRNGSLWAHHWGCQIDGGGLHLDLLGARKYLLDSFAQMFPEHECGEECGCTDITREWAS